MFLPDYIDLSKPEKYILCVRIEPDKFSFSLNNPEDEKFFCYRETNFSKDSDLLENIKRIIFDYNFLTHIFKATNVLIVSDEYEIIPEEIHSKSQLSEIYNFSHYKSASHIESKIVPETNEQFIFNIDKDIYSFLVRSLFNPHFFHSCELLMSYFQKISTKHQYKDNNIFLNLQENHADIIGYNSKNQLINIQTYDNKDEMDIVYFLLNFWEKAKLNQLNDNLHIYGKFIDQKAENSLREYIKNIHLHEIKPDKGLDKEETIAPIDLLILNEI